MSMLVNPFAHGATVFDPFFASVVLLCHCDGSNGSTTFTNIRFPTKGTPLSFTGSTAVSSTAPLFGNGSAAIAGGNIFGITSADYGMDAGDMTLEFALKTPNPSTLYTLLDLRNGAEPFVGPLIYMAGGTFVYHVNGATRITGGTVATSTWQQISVCKVSGTTKMFVAGTQVGSSYTDGHTYGQTPLFIGSNYVNGNGVVGNMDEIRITKGVGRYSGNYTVAAAAFPDQ